MTDLFAPVTKKNKLPVFEITREQARYLCEKVHYSGKLPSIGKYYFSNSFLKPCFLAVYGQPVSRGWSKSVIELQRLVRMPNCNSMTLSSFLASTIRELKRKSDYDFCISYADKTENHHGGIYQATNWTYVDFRPPRFMGFREENGNFLHCKTLYNRFGTSSVKYFEKNHSNWTKVFSKGKYLYVMPLNKRKKIILKENGWCELNYEKPNRS